MLFILPLLLMFLVSPAVAASGESRLLLRSGFEPPVHISGDMRRLRGNDGNSQSGWGDSAAWIESSRFVYLVQREKDLTDFMASYIRQVQGPRNDSSHALCLQSTADDPDYQSTSRNEYSLFGRNAPDDYKEGYVRYWMKLEADLGRRIETDSKTPWYMIMEWKERSSDIKHDEAECRAAGQRRAGSNNYRINIGIHRQAGESAFRWVIRGEHPQPCRHTEWRYLNPTAEVPLGDWYLVEAYMRKHSERGRVYFAVNGIVVLDTDELQPDGFTGRTTHASNPLELAFWSPMKNYHSMEWNKAGPVEQCYDDFELWTGLPPGHPAANEGAEK